MFKKLFIAVVSLFLICGYAAAYDRPVDMPEHFDACKPKSPDYDKCEKQKRKEYQNWYKNCQKYHGRECTYSKWTGNSSWSEQAWINYWNSDTYKNVQKVNDKVNIIKELFTW